MFSLFPLTTGGYTRHIARHMDEPLDADKAFLAGTGEAWRRAIADAERVYRRPRRDLVTECGHALVRVVFRAELKLTAKRDTAVYETAKRLGCAENTVRAALADVKPKAPPPLTADRIREMLVANIAFAEISGDARTAEILRRRLRKLDGTTF
jgi:hypothetical protein